MIHQKEEESKNKRKVYKIKFSINSPCPCDSGKKYKSCCLPYHKGASAKTALALMRSRYSAYALSLSSYIIKTTHSKNSEYLTNTSQWEKELLEFSSNCDFQKLEILEVEENDFEGYITFKATIQSHQEDCSFIEKSHFLLENNKWYYFSGVFL